jgi:hypothetical protein
MTREAELEVVVDVNMAGMDRGFTDATKRVRVFGNDLKREADRVEQQAAQNAREYALSWANEIEKTFNREMSRIKAAQLGGTLSRNEAREAGIKAGNAFNQGIQSVIARGQATGAFAGEEGAAAFTSIAGSLKDLEKKGLRAAVSLNTVRAGMTSVLAGSLQTAPGVAQVSSALGVMAIGMPEMIAVLAGIAAVSFAWHVLTKDARENKKATDEAVNAIDRLTQKKRDGATGELNRGIVELDAKIAKKQADIRRIAQFEGADSRGSSMTKAKAELAEMLTQRQIAEDEVKKIVADTIKTNKDNWEHAQKELEQTARDRKISPLGFSEADVATLNRIIDKEAELRKSIIEMQDAQKLAGTKGEFDDISKKIAEAKRQADLLRDTFRRLGPDLSTLRLPVFNTGQISDRGANALANRSELGAIAKAGIAGAEPMDVPSGASVQPAAAAAQDRLAVFQNAGIIPEEFRKSAIEDAKIIRDHAQAVQHVNDVLNGNIGLKGALKKTGSFLKNAGSQFLQVFNPISMVGQVLGGALQELGRNVAPIVEILGHALTPILKALFPIFKGVVIAATYVGQIFFKVAEGVAKAMGGLVYGLGVLVKLLPLDRGLGEKIKGAGKTLIKFGDAMGDASDALGDARKEIKGLEWLDESAKKTAESLSGVPLAFNAALLRYQTAMTVPGTAAGTPTTPGGNGGVTITGGVTIQTQPGENPESFFDRFMEIVRRRAAAGNPQARSWLQSMIPRTTG